MNEYIVTLNSFCTGARKYLKLAANGVTYTDKKAEAYRFATFATAKDTAVREQSRIGQSVMMDIMTEAVEL